ncbi:MAG TPA: hypothetical protein DC049_10690 [Spirochaetia bacterium]|nr:hypothetical protein [Spirochaetia bacterium]
MEIINCPQCGGMRLNKSALSVFINKKNIQEVSRLQIKDLARFIGQLKFTGSSAQIASPVLKEIKKRINFLENVGLDYLTLNRRSSTLSGGEAQRIRLAAQLGSGLTGCLYILDEPSIGLHQQDNKKLIATLKNLRGRGNTVIVVEHDEETMLACDYLVDLGPGAGKQGGQIVLSFCFFYLP